MLSLMIFMFCFFLGFAALFLHLARKMDAMTRQLSDEHAQLRVLMRAMESRLEHLEIIEADANMAMPDTTQADEGAPQKPETEAANNDPLLHLSFDAPRSNQNPPPPDPALNLRFEPGKEEL